MVGERICGLVFEKNRAEFVNKVADFFFFKLRKRGGRAAHGAGALCLARAPRPRRGRARLTVEFSFFLSPVSGVLGRPPHPWGGDPISPEYFLPSIFFFFFLTKTRKKPWVASHEALF